MESPKGNGGTPLSSPTGWKTTGIFVYSVPLSICLGLQYLIPSMMGLLHIPLKTFSWLCLLPDDPARGNIISKILFLSGIATIVQSLFGARSPVIITPSIMFIFAAIENLKTDYWEKFSDGDLYAMGPALRDEYFLSRSSEFQGFLITSSLWISAIFGIFWYLKIKLPTATVSATLISTCILNIMQLTGGTNHSSLALLSFGFMLLFFIIHEVKIPCLKVITSEDYKLNLRVFKFFGAFFTFLFCMIINAKFEFDFESYLGRTAEPHSWLSYNFIPQDFNVPKMSVRTWLLLPSFLSQVLASYCCYGLLHEHQGKQTISILSECAMNIISPLFGLFMPLAIEPASLGLWCLTEIKNNETTVISGSLLVVISAFLQVVGLCSYVPYTLIYGIHIFAHGQIILKALERKDHHNEDLKTITFSVLSGLMISQLIPGFGEEIYCNILLVFLKSPVFLTFSISLLLRLPHYTIKKRSNPNLCKG